MIVKIVIFLTCKRVIGRWLLSFSFFLVLSKHQFHMMVKNYAYALCRGYQFSPLRKEQYKKVNNDLILWNKVQLLLFYRGTNKCGQENRDVDSLILIPFCFSSLGLIVILGIYLHPIIGCLSYFVLPIIWWSPTSSLRSSSPVFLTSPFHNLWLRN